MGTGSSFMRSHDDDILGSDLEGTNGVLKRIPIEIKPRGKLGLRSVGSLGRSKPKGGSLRYGDLRHKYSVEPAFFV